MINVDLYQIVSVRKVCLMVVWYVSNKYSLSLVFGRKRVSHAWKLRSLHVIDNLHQLLLTNIKLRLRLVAR